MSGEATEVMEFLRVVAAFTRYRKPPSAQKSIIEGLSFFVEQML